MRILVLFIFLFAWASTGLSQTLSDPVDDAASDFKLYESAIMATHSGDVKQATKLLEVLVSINPRFVGAWLDLAMLYCQSNRSAEARDLLFKLKKTLPEVSDKVEELSPVILRACEFQHYLPTSSIEVAHGYNSNVNLGALQREMVIGSSDSPLLLQLSPESKPRGDSYLDVRGTGMFTLGNRDAVYASFFVRDYANMSSFNQHMANIDWQHYWISDKWQGIFSAGHRWIALNGSIYDRTLQASAELHSPLKILDGRVFVGTNISQTNYPTAKAFDIFSTLFRTGIQWRQGFQIEAGWRWNTALNNRPGGDAAGYQVVGRYDQVLPKEWRFGILGRFQSMRDKSIFFPGLFDLNRSQQSLSFLASLEHDFKNGWVAGIDYSNYSQDDNIPIFSFKGNDTRVWLRSTF